MHIFRYVYCVFKGWVYGLSEWGLHRLIKLGRYMQVWFMNEVIATLKWGLLHWEPNLVSFTLTLSNHIKNRKQGWNSCHQGVIHMMMTVMMNKPDPHYATIFQAPYIEVVIHKYCNTVCNNCKHTKALVNQPYEKFTQSAKFAEITDLTLFHGLSFFPDTQKTCLIRKHNGKKFMFTFWYPDNLLVGEQDGEAFW